VRIPRSRLEEGEHRQQRRQQHGRHGRPRVSPGPEHHLRPHQPTRTNPELGAKTRRARRSSTFRSGAEDPPRRPPHRASVRRRPRGRGARPAEPTAATRHQVDTAHPARGRRLKTKAPHCLGWSSETPAATFLGGRAGLPTGCLRRRRGRGRGREVREAALGFGPRVAS
jgi:hypothetical protein